MINHFLMCPVIDRETKFALYFTIKGLVILSILIIFIWQTMVKYTIMLHKQTIVDEV